MAFEVETKLEVYIDGETVLRKCFVSGALDNEDEPNSAVVTVQIIEFDDEPSQAFHFGFHSDSDGLLEINLPSISDPITNYTICVAGKVVPAVAAAAYQCYDRKKGWKHFLDCMKTKAPAIGYKTLWSLLICTKKFVGLD